MAGPLRIGIAGALGRMGGALATGLERRSDATIALGFDLPGTEGQPWRGGVLGGPRDVADCDVVLDFTAPTASVALAEAAAARGGPALVIGSTGWGEAEDVRIWSAAKRIPIVKTGNYSLGVNILAGLVQQAAERLSASEWDIEVFEAHHRRKVDAPSGTALMLGESAARGRQTELAAVQVRARDGITGPRPEGAIGFSVMRGGGIVGEHSVSFAAEEEVLTLSHTARDRSLFARGAIAAALWVAGKPPGLYDMMDVLGFRADVVPDQILTLDATGQLAALSTGRISAVELLEATHRRYEEANQRLNAVVATDMARAREKAKAVDDLRTKGDTLPPLAGLPMTIKDTFDVEGMPASSGLDAFRHGKRPDAVVVAHARAAGAVIWGKTNVPVLAGDFQTFNGLYGTTNNPWDLERTPGGSSGGAAAALASRITSLEIGSDIGGSLRTPASFCGVYSHKPTWGVVSQVGHVPPRPGAHAERDLNVVGPMARSARDLRLLLSVLEAGPLSARPQAPAELKGLRVGLWLNQPELVLDPEVKAVLEAFAGELANHGAEVTPIASPVQVEALLASYRTLLASLLAQDMPTAQLAAMRRVRGVAKVARSMGAGPDSWAGLALAYTASHLDWMAADEARALARDQIRRVFARFDVILAPVNPVAAFPHDQRPFSRRALTLSDGTKHPYLAMLRWIALATACGLPATAIPAGQTAAGLPVGAQLIGPRGADSRTLAIAEAIEDRLGGFVPPPAASPVA